MNTCDPKFEARIRVAPRLGVVSRRILSRSLVAASLAGSLALPIISGGCSRSKSFKAGNVAASGSPAAYIAQLERSDPLTSECMPEYREATGPMDKSRENRLNKTSFIDLNYKEQATLAQAARS